MEYPIKIKNVFITETTRKDYKYVVAREVMNKNGDYDYWFYNFVNDLYDASMMLRETGNGVIFEITNVIGENMRTLAQLACEMEEFFEERICDITYPLDGAVAIVPISEDKDVLCKEIRIICSPLYNGCFIVSIPSDMMPLSEQRYIAAQHFSKIDDAYSFAVKRAIEINSFFKH